LVSAIPGVDHTQILSILGEPFNVLQMGFDASWELDLWGRVRRNVQASQAQSAQAEADARQMRLVVAAEVAKTYFQLRSAQRQRAIAQLEWKSGRDSEGLLRARADGGLADETTWLRQNAQNQQLEATLEQLKAREAGTLNRMTLLCGDPPGALNALLAPQATDTDLALPYLTVGVPAELARNRPDVASAEQRLVAATANIGVAVADLYPRVTLGASFGFESLKSDQLSDWASRQWTIGPSLNLPLFDSGRRRATVQLRELQQQEAAIAFQHVVLQAWHDVDDSISTYRAEQVVQDAAMQRVRASETSDSIAQARFENGMTDDLVALAADRELSEARLAQVQSRERLETSLVGVYKSLGGPAVER
jgi:NodT family efflux transporter outer membrane factor (OMF) lipoprotein